MGKFKRWWTHLKRKFREGSLDITELDRALVSNAYLLKHEYAKCNRLTEELNEHLLVDEENECVEHLKAMIQKRVDSERWTEIENLPPLEFVKAIFASDKNSLKLDTDSRKQCYLCMKRIIEIQGLKGEIKGRLDVESYYGVFYQLQALKHVNGHIYSSVQQMTKQSKTRMHDLIIENKDLDEELLVIKISEEIRCIITQEIKNLVQKTPANESPVQVGLEIDAKDIKEAMKEFQELPCLLEKPKLREYILFIKKGLT